MTITQIPSSSDKRVLAAEFPGVVPALLFNYWTKPELICTWWPQKAEIDPRPGGVYHLSWPQMHWHLRGLYTAFEPGKKLAFTWRWDHDPPGIPVTTVEIIFEPLPTGGTGMLLTHSPYSDSVEDQQMRVDHHLAGWQHFIPKLQEVVSYISRGKRKS
jgi:uncharacterized protein YndB with AHSA1/START domain